MYARENTRPHEEVILLPYGTGELSIRVPTRNLLGVARPKARPGLAHPMDGIRCALACPVSSDTLQHLLLRRRPKTVAIVVDDQSRPTPTSMLLEAVLGEVLAAGVDESSVTILVATGTHRGPASEDLRRILGSSVTERMRVIVHDCKDRRMLSPFVSRRMARRVFVNKHFLGADFRILTGYVRPHPIFGFTGGRKSVLPGLCDADTVRYTHRPAWSAIHPMCDLLQISGNPAHEEALSLAREVGVDYIVNVVLNAKKEIVDVAAGDVYEAWLSLTRVVKEMTCYSLDRPADIVVSTPGGFPNDINLYQTLGAALVSRKRPVFRKGATMIFASACSEGVGSDTLLRLKTYGSTPSEVVAVLDRVGIEADGHAAYLYSYFTAKYRLSVMGYTKGVEPEELRSAFVTPLTNLQAGIDAAIRRCGADARVLVVPDAKSTVVVLNRSREGKQEDEVGEGHSD